MTDKNLEMLYDTEPHFTAIKDRAEEAMLVVNMVMDEADDNGHLHGVDSAAMWNIRKHDVLVFMRILLGLLDSIYRNCNDWDKGFNEHIDEIHGVESS